MLRLLLILALLLWQLPAGPLVVRVVFVATDDGSFTQEQESDLLARVERTLAFWHERAPEPVATRVEHGGSFVAIGELAPWLETLGAHEELTVYVIANELTGRPLMEQTFGLASYEKRFAVVASFYPLGGEALLAHELGHLLYNLRDTYPCGETDMMCNPVSAYRLGRLGCATLAQLGRECIRVGLGMLGG